jgi:ribosomal protein S18 acetylase RimI-like enzyme
MLVKNEWLSSHFRINIYDAKEIPLLNVIAASDMIQFLSPEIILNRHFQFTQTRIALVKDIKSSTISKLQNDVKLIDQSNFKNFSTKKFRIFTEHSRFRKISLELTDDYYYKWFFNSIIGIKDQHCAGILDDSTQSLKAFVCYSITNGNLSIGLIGVFPEYANQGLGTQLMKYLINQALMQNINVLKVVTQGENKQALNYYLANGFKIKDIDYWYYGGKIIDKL